MGTYLSTVALVAGILVVLASPLFYTAWRMGRRDIIRKFALAGGAIALVMGVVGVTSERLVEQCIAANHLECFDAGYRGFQVLVMGGYAIVAWVKTSGLRS